MVHGTQPWRTRSCFSARLRASSRLRDYNRRDHTQINNLQRNNCEKLSTYHRSVYPLFFGNPFEHHKKRLVEVRCIMDWHRTSPQESSSQGSYVPLE